LRLYLNFFQPVMVLVEKERHGARITKRYDQAKTPYQRVLDAPDVAEGVKTRLRALYPSLNPAALLRAIEARQQTLWQLAIRPGDANMRATASTDPGGAPRFPAPLLTTRRTLTNLHQTDGEK
jgi:hypothetical protein